MIERLDLITDLPVDECLARLRKTADAHPWSLEQLWFSLPEGTIETSVYGRFFMLSAWPRRYTRNSFSPLFLGTVRSAPHNIRSHR